MNIMSKDLPGNLYICLTCHNWQVFSFLELVAIHMGSAPEPVCVSCDQIMYNVLETDGLQLAEEPEPEPVEHLHPFDAALLFDAETFKDNPMFQDVKRWITDDLKKPLEDVIWLDIACPPVQSGITKSGLKQFAPGVLTTFTIRFKDGEHKKTVNRADYQQSVEQPS